jgi:replicative DNA helicase
MIGQPRRVEVAVDLGGRVPPHNDEAEAAVLSAMLYRREAIESVFAVIEGPDDFYSDANRRIAEAIFDLHARGRPVDAVTLCNLLSERNRLQAVGGHGYVARLLDATPAVAHVEAHAAIVRSKARRRAVLHELQTLSALAYQQEVDDDDFVGEVGERTFKACAVVRDEGVHDMRSLVRLEEDRLGAIARGEQSDPSLPTHFTKLDSAIGGLYPGEVTVVAAKPGIGKTAFMGNLAVKVARNPWNDHEIGVLVFSLEMRRQRLLWRLSGSEAGINTKRLRAGVLRPRERERLTTAHATLEKLPIFVDDSASMSPMRARARLRRLQQTFDRPPVYDKEGRLVSLGRRIGLVMFDYLTILQADHVERGMNREQFVAQIASSLRLMAAETGIPIVELAQLKKNLAHDSGMPSLSDLRESGQIEQDAHNIIFLHRPEHYVADKEKMDPTLRGLALANVAKSRDGDVRLVKLHFANWCTRFDNEGVKPEPADPEEEEHDPQRPLSLFDGGDFTDPQED